MYLTKLDEWVNKNRGNPDAGFHVRSYDLNRDNWLKSKEHCEFFECKTCGYPQMIEPGRTDMDKLEKAELCFHCNFWDEKIKSLKTNKNTYVLNGQYLSDAGYSASNRNHLGFSGQEWFLYCLDGSGLVHTNNMWSAGKFPDYLGIEDTVQHVTKRTSEEDLAFIEALYPDMSTIWRAHIESIRKFKAK